MGQRSARRASIMAGSCSGRWSSRARSRFQRVRACGAYSRLGLLRLAVYACSLTPCRILRTSSGEGEGARMSEIPAGGAASRLWAALDGAQRVRGEDPFLYATEISSVLIFHAGLPGGGLKTTTLTWAHLIA